MEDQELRTPGELTTVDSGLNAAADHEETRTTDYNQEAEHEQAGGETQPLLLVSNRLRRPRAIRRVLTYLGKLSVSKLAVCSGYVILIVVALLVGISSGGWSFFRFTIKTKFRKCRFGITLSHLIIFMIILFGYLG